MAIHIVCLTSSGGLPLFSRKKGDCENLPFSTIGSLNGAHMFCKSQGVNLKATYLEDGVVIVWKEFEKSITLIGSAKGITENVLRDLLELTFNAIILFIGYNEIKHNKNIDRLKREFKNCYPTIDQLLESCEADFLKFSNCCLCTDGQQILAKLNEFSEQFGSPFCCLLSRQKIICGTEGWWDLNIIDRKLLIALFSSSSAIKKDFPVYLPKRSPNIAYRFVSIQLCPDIYLCVLCGAQPTYMEIENLAQQIWINDMNLLQTNELLMNRNFPTNIKLDSSILGLILINKIHLKYFITRNLQSSLTSSQPQQQQQQQQHYHQHQHHYHHHHQQQLLMPSTALTVAMGGGGGGGGGATSKRMIGNDNNLLNLTNSYRLDILRTFFHQSVDIIDKFLNNKNNRKMNNNNNNSDNNKNNIFKSTESYWCSEYHKCHAYSIDDNLICILYVSNVPIHTMRLITQRTLNLIISEKNISW